MKLPPSRALRLAARLLLALGGLLLISLAPAAARPRAMGPEGDLRAELVGTWRVELPPKWAAGMVAYFLVNQDGTFRIVALASPSGMPCRIEAAGTWELKGRDLVAKLTQSDAPGLAGQSATERLLSATPTRLVIQGDEATLSLQRRRLPGALPPDLFGPIILLTESYRRELVWGGKGIAYPSDAVMRDVRGFGIFRLHVDLHDGGVRRVEIERSTGAAILDKAAVAALQTWPFKPPLIRLLHRRRDPGNTSGEIVFRFGVNFVHSGPSRH